MKTKYQELASMFNAITDYVAKEWAADDNFIDKYAQGLEPIILAMRESDPIEDSRCGWYIHIYADKPDANTKRE